MNPRTIQNLPGLIKKRFYDILLFGRFWYPNSDLSVSQAEACCEAFWRVTSMFTHRRTMLLNWARFSNRI